MKAKPSKLIHRETIYGWSIYERKPKPKRKTKFCVGTGPLKEYKDFKSLAAARKWIKEIQDNDSVYRTVLPIMPKKID